MAATGPCRLSTAASRSPRSYVQRRPERTVLYQLVREHLETFLQEGRQRSAHGDGYPRYVEQTFRSYLQCRIMAHGCAKLHCAGYAVQWLATPSC